MGTSLIGVSSIHLLKVFVQENANATLLQQQLDMGELWKKIIIHMAFIVGAFALAFIDKIHIKSEAQELKNEVLEKEIEESHHKNQHNEEKVHSPAGYEYVPGHGHVPKLQGKENGTQG
jgi:hypothetical protein